MLRSNFKASGIRGYTLFPNGGSIDDTSRIDDTIERIIAPAVIGALSGLPATVVRMSKSPGISKKGYGNQEETKVELFLGYEKPMDAISVYADLERAISSGYDFRTGVRMDVDVPDLSRRNWSVKLAKNRRYTTGQKNSVRIVFVGEEPNNNETIALTELGFGVESNAEGSTILTKTWKGPFERQELVDLYRKASNSEPIEAIRQRYEDRKPPNEKSRPSYSFSLDLGNKSVQRITHDNRGFNGLLTVKVTLAGQTPSGDKLVLDLEHNCEYMYA